MFAPQVYDIIQYTNVKNETRFINKTRWFNKTHNITIYINKTRWTNQTRFINKTRWFNKTHNITIYINKTRWTNQTRFINKTRWFNKTHNITIYINKTRWTNQTRFINKTRWFNKTYTIERIIWVNKHTNQSHYPTVISEKFENTTHTFGKPITVNDLVIWGSCLVIGFMGGCFFSYVVFKFKEFVDSWFGCLDCHSLIKSSEPPPKKIDIQIHPGIDTLRRSNSPKARKRMEI